MRIVPSKLNGLVIGPHRLLRSSGGHQHVAQTVESRSVIRLQLQRPVQELFRLRKLESPQ